MTEETIGERLRRLRVERGLSQRDLAQAGTSCAFISRIEGGDRTPSIKAMRKLAARLGVSAHYLETGEPDPVERYRVENERLRAQVLRLTRRVEYLEGRLREERGEDIAAAG